jgi:hypothetical protein
MAVFEILGWASWIDVNAYKMQLRIKGKPFNLDETGLIALENMGNPG